MISLLKRCSRIALALALLFPVPAGWGFERETHADITVAGHDRSTISDALRDFGIDPARRLNGGLLGSRLSVDWLVKGARDEDDTISATFARYRNHFYDPVNHRGLTATAFGIIPIRGERAPDWALEDAEKFVAQDFSYRDARLAFLTALIAPAPDDRESALSRTFEILGHVVHPLQDMASPPHTRNDIHGGFGFGPTSLFERYLDQEQVRRRLNFSGTPVRFGLPREYWVTGDGRGLAEFVNRNFVSEGTNFRSRAEGAVGGGYPGPVLRLGTDEQGRPFEMTLDMQTQLEPGLRDRNGNLIEGSVTFFANNFRDPITSAPLRNDRMSTLSLFDRELELKAASLLFTLNRYNVEAQAAFLIPRAVGYSAGLLDYFFRGRLDVDLLPEPDDPSLLRVAATNGSTDDLISGTLTLYTDDPSGRRSALASAQVEGRIQQGKDLFSTPPSIPAPAEEDAERPFLAVYRGTLGLEVAVPNADQTLDFPGGVIGKVVGGVRVEEVFADGEEWKLRTPKGVFGLDPPLQMAEYEQVKWGDGPDLLVARTAFGPGQPNRVDAFEVPRVANSADLATLDTPDGPKVPATRTRSAVLPAKGIPTGTTVNFHQTWTYRQQMVRVQEITVTWQCQDGQAVGPATVTATAPQRETLATVNADFPLTFPVVLDADHYFSSFAPNYAWELVDVGADPSGRLLGLGLVFGTFPDIPTVPVTRYVINGTTGLPVEFSRSFLSASYPPGGDPFLWALVDLSEGRLIASTAEPTMAVSYRKVSEGSPLSWPDGQIGVAAHTTLVACETTDLGWGIRHVNRRSLPPGTVPVVTLRVDERVGDGELLLLTGLLRKDLRAALAGAGFVDSEVGAIENSEPVIYVCLATDPIGDCQAVEVNSRFSVVSRDPAFLEDARRPSAATGGERLVLLAKDYTALEIPLSAIAVLEANPPRSQVRYQPRGGAELRTLSGVTSALALVSEKDFNPFAVSTTLVALDGSRTPVVFPDVNLAGPFRMLEPSYLYNVNDLKFYRLAPPLQQTALPRKLADPPDGSNPVGNYHAIRAP